MAVFFPTRRELRLAAYLQGLDRQDRPVVSSADLARSSGVTPERFRRDMSWVVRRIKTRLGRQGVGYDVPHLRQVLIGLLHVDVPRKVAVLGENGEDGVQAAVRASPYFRLVRAEEEPDFVLLVGRGPWPEVPPGAVVLHWSGTEDTAAGKRAEPPDPVRLLLAVSAGLVR